MADHEDDRDIPGVYIGGEGWDAPQPEDPEAVTPQSNRARLERLEKLLRRDRVRSAVLYTLAFACVVATLLQIAHVQDLRRDRVALEQRTNRLICERQREAITRLRETKQAQIRSDRVLEMLIGGILEIPPRPDRVKSEVSSDAQVREQLSTARGRLRGNIETLDRGRERLGRLLIEVRCDRLPSDKPFKE